jgi:DNA-binding protein HU-beta
VEVCGGLDHQNIVGAVIQGDHEESPANKGFFVQPKMKGLVIQGKCLTCTSKTSFIAGNFPKRQEVAVNRTELVEAVATNAGLDKREAEKAVMAVIDTVITQTRSGDKVSVFGFGTFNPTSRAARIGRNPRTGAPVRIAASKSVRFAPASAFKSALNTKAGAKKAAPAKKAAKKAAAATKATAAKKAPAKKAAKSAKKK